MAVQPAILFYDPLTVVGLPVGAVALVFGDICSWESNALVLFNAATEDITFPGIAMGNRDATGDIIPVAMKCVLRLDLSSASYDHGDGLKYVSKNTLVTDGAANTIAWKWSLEAGTITAGKVMFDVLAQSKMFSMSA